MDHRSDIKVHHISSDFSISELKNAGWDRAHPLEIGTYWTGEKAPATRRFSASLLWSETALYVKFEANQNEPLILSEKANLGSKTLKMWDRDVCEIFIAPDQKEPRKYFEFEVAPNGEWIDLTIDLTSGERVTGWDFRSGMTSAARVDGDRILMAIKVEWKALGKTPNKGETWLGNLFRCVGKEPTRGYLAWRPTLTAEPAFHVPEKFGEFKFVG
ncbi:MAG: carbohydrate-binding family 9-like protein [Acidobacteriota bacterium]